MKIINSIILKKHVVTACLFLISVGAYSYNEETSSDGLTKLRIMTYNVNGLPDTITKMKKHKSFEKKKTRLAKLCAFLKEKNAKTESVIDAVMLQEVWLKKDQKMLAQESGYQYSCYQDDKNFQSGLIILSNNPISACYKKSFQNKAPDSGAGSIIDKSIKRAYLKAVIVLPNGQDFVLTNTHLISNYKPEAEDNPQSKFKFKQDPSEETRLNQLNEILTDLSVLDKPSIIGGDLNTGPEYPLWSKLIEEKGVVSTNGYSIDSNYESTYSDTNINVTSGEGEGALDFFLTNEYIKVENTLVYSKEIITTTNTEVAEGGDSFNDRELEILEAANLSDNSSEETVEIADLSDHYAKIIEVSVCCDPETNIAAR